MLILVSAETLLLVLVSLLVVGLLRSHAEILRQLSLLTGEAATPTQADASQPEGPELSGLAEAIKLAGETLDGEPIVIDLAAHTSDTLVAFLSGGCLSCDTFWRGLDEERLGLPGGAQPVIVTKGAEAESISHLRKVAPNGIPMVMSSPAWQEYAVPVSPYFFYVERGSGRIRGQGGATTWEKLISLVDAAVADEDIDQQWSSNGRNGASANGAGRGSKGRSRTGSKRRRKK